MSANSNTEAVSNQGEFRSRVPPSESLTTKGVSFAQSLRSTALSQQAQHAPGVKVGNDTTPEFNAQILPAGTAPSDRTFKPNTQNEVPGQANNPNISKETWTSAQDTIGGATSADIHTGYGHPGSGQTSQELHGGGKERSGLSGVGANKSDPVRERGLDVNVPKGTRGKSGIDRQDILGAEERVSESAETIAAERD